MHLRDPLRPFQRRDVVPDLHVLDLLPGHTVAHQDGRGAFDAYELQFGALVLVEVFRGLQVPKLQGGAVVEVPLMVGAVVVAEFLRDLFE